jgi:hypothetical protein
MSCPRPPATSRVSSDGGYRRREPERTLLHEVVAEHLATFLADARARSDGAGVPRFVAA